MAPSARCLHITLTVLTVGSAATIGTFALMHPPYVTAYHPILMALGILVTLSQGVLAYTMDLGEKVRRCGPRSRGRRPPDRRVFASHAAGVDASPQSGLRHFWGPSRRAIASILGRV